MGTSITPQVLRALYTKATTALPAVQVYLGFNMGEDQNKATLMVGVDDIASTAAASSSDASQTMATLGTPRSRDHVGSVTCAALSWSGETTQAAQGAAMDAAYATVAEVEKFLRDDPTLGLLPPGRMVAQIGDDRLSLDTYSEGVSALVVFTVNFAARI